MILSLNLEMLINKYYQLGFFLLRFRFVLYIFCLSGFCCVLLLIHGEDGIGLNVELPYKSTS